MNVNEPPDTFEAAIAPLWQRAQAGDEAAYQMVLKRMAQRLRAYFKRRLGDHPDNVEDLVQETLLALHMQRGTHDPTLPVSHWMHAIARYKLVDHWRRHGRRDALHDPVQDFDDYADDALPQDRAAARHDLASLLARLPAAQRRAIELTKIAGLSVEEAAAHTGDSTSAIKVQVHRGLKRLAAWVRGRPGAATPGEED